PPEAAPANSAHSPVMSLIVSRPPVRTSMICVSMPRIIGRGYALGPGGARFLRRESLTGREVVHGGAPRAHPSCHGRLGRMCTMRQPAVKRSWWKRAWGWIWGTIGLQIHHQARILPRKVKIIALVSE